MGSPLSTRRALCGGDREFCPGLGRRYVFLLSQVAVQSSWFIGVSMYSGDEGDVRGVNVIVGSVGLVGVFLV